MMTQAAPWVSFDNRNERDFVWTDTCRTTCSSPSYAAMDLGSST